MAILKVNAGTKAAPLWVPVGIAYNYYKARSYKSATQSIADSTDSTVSWTAFDYISGFFMSGNSVQVPRAAFVRVSGFVTFAATASTGRRVLRITKNGTIIAAASVWPSSNQIAPLSAYAEVQVAVGDLLALEVRQESGAALNLTTACALTVSEFQTQSSGGEVWV